MIQMYELMFIW